MINLKNLTRRQLTYIAVALIVVVAVAIALLVRALVPRVNTDDFRVYFDERVTVPYDDTVRNELTEDIANLERIFGTKMMGMAYPYGTFDDRVVSLVEEARLQYARTTISSHSFDIPDDLLRLPATCHHKDERLMELAREFLAADDDTPRLFYVWGHSYEFDINNNWEVIEEFCRLMAGHDDIFYGTNTECLLAEH